MKVTIVHQNSETTLRRVTSIEITPEGTVRASYGDNQTCHHVNAESIMVDFEAHS